VTYLEQAAARGSADAYLLLASSYERGGLTQKSLSLAYSYLSALAKVTGDPGVANKAMSLRSSVSDAGAAEATAAKLAASCCLSATNRPAREEEN
jgi:TPR repeat protein